MASERQPVIYLISGPNGAGKTTFAKEFLPAAHVIEFLNADLLAAGLSPLHPSAMAVRSARLILGRWRELLAIRRDFAFESTLSGRTYASMLEEAKKPATASAWPTFGSRMCAFHCSASGKDISKAAMMFRPAMCGGGLFRAWPISSAAIFPWLMKHFCLMLRPTRRD